MPATGSAGDVPVTVEARGVRSQAVPFRLLIRPRIERLEPEVVMPGDLVTAAGEGLQSTGLAVFVGGQPAEIAAAVRFILDAPAMTGQMIALDGGQHLTWGEGERP